MTLHVKTDRTLVLLAGLMLAGFLMLLVMYDLYTELETTRELLDWVVASNQQDEYRINGTIPGSIPDIDPQ